MVDTLSIRSGAAGVAYGATHEHATDGVEEWQTTSFGLLAKPSDDGIHVLLAPVAATSVHIAGSGVAGAVGRRGDADGGEKGLEGSTGETVRRRLTNLHRVRLVCLVNSPGVAVLRDDARHDLVERIPTFPAPPL